MASPVYSVVLWELPPGWPTGTQPQSPPVPTGFVWVVREITAYNGSGIRFGQVGPVQLLAGALIIWTPQDLNPISGVPYTASDVRYVLEEGDVLQLVTNDTSWQLRVSGYQLTASA